MYIMTDNIALIITLDLQTHKLHYNSDWLNQGPLFYVLQFQFVFLDCRVPHQHVLMHYKMLVQNQHT